jgi:hypothetical protein
VLPRIQVFFILLHLARGVAAVYGTCLCKCY